LVKSVDVQACEKHGKIYEDCKYSAVNLSAMVLQKTRENSGRLWDLLCSWGRGHGHQTSKRAEIVGEKGMRRWGCCSGKAKILHSFNLLIFCVILCEIIRGEGLKNVHVG